MEEKMFKYTMQYINQRLGCKCIEVDPWPGIDCIAFDPEDDTTVFFEICYHNDENKFMSQKDREAAMLEYMEEMSLWNDPLPIERMRWDRITWQMTPSLGESKALFKYAGNI